MALDDDMEMIEMMVVEATEHLDNLDGVLLCWEQDPSQATPDEMNQAFRDLHTIKGGFAFFGLNSIKELAHVMEQLLDEVRNGSRELDVNLVGNIADGANLLRMMVEDVWNSNEVDIAAMVGRLAGPDSEKMAQTSTTDANGVLMPTTSQWQRIRSNSWQAMALSLDAKRDLEAKGRNIIDITNQLTALGEVIDVTTDLSQIDGLENCLNTHYGIRVLYASMAPVDMIAEDIDVDIEHIQAIEPSPAMLARLGGSERYESEPDAVEPGNPDFGSALEAPDGAAAPPASSQSDQSPATGSIRKPAQQPSTGALTQRSAAQRHQDDQNNHHQKDANNAVNAKQKAKTQQGIQKKDADSKQVKESKSATKMVDVRKRSATVHLEASHYSHGQHGQHAQRGAGRQGTARHGRSKGKPATVKLRNKPAETIRVPVDAIERLLNMSGELVLLRNEVRQFFETPLLEHQLGKQLSNRSRQVIEEMSRQLGNDVDPGEAIAHAVQGIDRFLSAPMLRDRAVHQVMRQMESISNKIQDTVMELRLQPVSVVFQKVPRMVRGLAQTLNKQIRVETTGGDVELDKTVIEALSDPFTHMVRNSCDHGIESPEDRKAAGKPAEGVVTVAARHEAGSVLIDITDDGAGIDHKKLRAAAVKKGLMDEYEAESLSDGDAVRLIFHPGFSMAKEVSEVSGRGVGMDVVLSTIERLGGSVDIETMIGEGTTFTLRMPLTLAIMSALVVESGSQRFAIPKAALQEICLTSEQQPLEYIGDKSLFRLRGRLIPVLSLSDLLHLPSQRKPSDQGTLVIAAASHGQFAVLVDNVVSMLDIVVKPLVDELNCGMYAGATILGNGAVAPILDLALMGRRVGLMTEGEEEQTDESPEEHYSNDDDVLEVVVLRGPDDARWAIELDQVERLVRIEREQIEAVGGIHMVQLTGNIVPLVHIADVLPERREVPRTDPMAVNNLPVALYKHGDHTIGLVAEQVLDVVSAHLTNRRPPSRHGVRFCATIDERIHEFLDIELLVDSISGMLSTAVAQFPQSHAAPAVVAEESTDLSPVTPQPA